MGPDGDMASRGGRPWQPEEYTCVFEREITATDDLPSSWKGPEKVSSSVRR